MANEELTDILASRGADYGDYSEVARVAQALKSVIEPFGPNLNDPQKESLDMFCSKIARIVCGDPNKKDSWIDIAGYATLIVRILEKQGPQLRPGGGGPAEIFKPQQCFGGTGGAGSLPRWMWPAPRA